MWDMGLDSLTPALLSQEESSDNEEEDVKPQQFMVLYLQRCFTAVEVASRG